MPIYWLALSSDRPTCGRVASSESALLTCDYRRAVIYGESDCSQQLQQQKWRRQRRQQQLWREGEPL